MPRYDIYLLTPYITLTNVAADNKDDAIAQFAPFIHPDADVVQWMAVEVPASVRKGDKCPNCGEDDIDNLVWTNFPYAIKDNVFCTTCGFSYEPS